MNSIPFFKEVQKFSVYLQCFPAQDNILSLAIVRKKTKSKVFSLEKFYPLSQVTVTVAICSSCSQEPTFEILSKSSQ